jgi:hypothetical protein
MSVLRRLVAIAYFVEVGLLLFIVPWTGFLERNYFVTGSPVLRAVVVSGFVRGAISGIGLLNLWAGLWELVGLFTDRHGIGEGGPVGHP